MATNIRSGEEISPMIFWHNCCNVSASLVTRLNTRPEENSARAPGAKNTTFLKTSCTSIARIRNPAWCITRYHMPLSYRCIQLNYYITHQLHSGISSTALFCAYTFWLSLVHISGLGPAPARMTSWKCCPSASEPISRSTSISTA